MEFESEIAKNLFGVINKHRPENMNPLIDPITEVILPELQQQGFSCTSADLQEVALNIAMAHERSMPSTIEAKMRRDANNFANVFMQRLGEQLAEHGMLMHTEE